MRDEYILETREIGDYRIKIYPDPSPLCPVQDWDMGACHIFEHLEHCRYWLSRNCDWKEFFDEPHQHSVAEALQRLAAEVVSQEAIIKYLKAEKLKDIKFIYDRKERQWKLIWKCNYGSKLGEWVSQFEVDPSDLKNDDYRIELLESFDEEDLIALIQEYAEDIVIKSWESSGYSQGDHMRGFSYMTKKMFDERCGFSGYYKTWQEQAMVVIEGEIKDISMWAWGDVKGYVLEKKVPFTKVYSDENCEDEEDVEWEEVGSCWSFFMETEELIEEVIAEYGLKEVEEFNEC